MLLSCTDERGFFLMNGFLRSWKGYAVVVPSDLTEKAPGELAGDAP